MDDVYRSPQSDPIPKPEAAGMAGFRYTIDPHGLTTFVIVMLWVSLLTDVIAILSDSGQLALLGQSTFTNEEVEANDLRQRYVGIASIVVYLTTAIPFLMWIYRANVNSRGFGAAYMQNTPGWSVGWYFVPIANLFKPFQAMKEIWQVSANPHDWQSQPGGALLGWWWGLWITGSVIGQISFRMPADTIPELEASTVASIIVSVESIVLTLVAMKLLKTIIERQDRLVGGARTAGGIQESSPEAW